MLSSQAVITHVLDGDTIEVQTFPAGRSRGLRSVETVRLIGIDAPERARPGAPLECGAREAKANMLGLAFGDRARDTDGDGLADADAENPEDFGALVAIRTDPTQDRRDRLGRLLAYVNVTHTGVDVAKDQIAKGSADAYVFDRRFGRYRRYRDAADAAQDAQRGVWSSCGGHFHPPL